MCDNKSNKHKENSNTYDNQGEEKNSSTPENKEKARDGNISIFEFKKSFCHSTYECACTAMDSIKDISMSIMEEFVLK